MLLRYSANGLVSKSNSTAESVQVEANLPGHPLPAHFFYSKCIARKRLTLKMKVKVKESTIRNGSIRWQISTSIKDILENFSLALIV